MARYMLWAVKNGPLAITAIYVALAGLWITFSDLALEVLIQDSGIRDDLQTVKGYAFVLVSGGALAVLIFWYRHALLRLQEAEARASSYAQTQESLLRAAEQQRMRLLAAVEQLADAILLVDAQGSVEYSNPAGQRLSGANDPDPVGGAIETVCRLSESQAAELRGALARGAPWHARMARNSPELGTADYLLNIYPVRGADGTVVNFVAVIRDETTERRLEAQVRQQQKLEAIGTLAGGIAHDFNNILAAILGYSEIALEELEPEHPIREDLRQILEAGQRARQLTQQILTFSRQAEVRRQPVRVDLIVREALRLIRATLPSTISVREELDRRDLYVLADAAQLHQILMNLCTNAYHAMRLTGGELRIGLRLVELDEDAARAYTEVAAGSFVQLTVSDTGHGIPAEHLDRIFEPFFTTKGQEGTGLGLSTCYGIVSQLGGAIRVYSEPGRGTVFHVYMPLMKIEDDGGRCEAEAPPVGRGERILLLDDEPALAEMGARMLTRLGYDVEVFTDSRAALEAFKTHPDAFDLVISDQTMPQLTGTQLVRRLRRIREDLPVILTTGFSELLSPKRVQHLRIGAVVPKPFLTFDLAAAVRGVLDRPGDGGGV